MHGEILSEQFPSIGTVTNPAVNYDEINLLLCYKIAPISGGGVAILEFRDIFDFRINPLNVEGLGDSKYPVNAWSFTEVTGADKNYKWSALNPRFWTVSFNDMTIEILFASVKKVMETRDYTSPSIALKKFIVSTL